jgi:hypothetical protein
VGELCKYYFSYKFTSTGLIYSPCKDVCDVIFKMLLLMKKYYLTDLKIAQLLNSYLIPNILTDRAWIDNDISILLAAPDLQAYLVWEHYM